MPLQRVGRVIADALRALLDDGAELAQDVEVVVDRPVADPAAAEVGDERLAEAVQQRPAEQDRDAAGAGVGVDVGDVRASRRCVGSMHELALVGVLRDAHAVELEEAGDDPDVADLRDVAQPQGVSPSRAATIAFETKFFAPRTVMLPFSGVPPWTVRT